MDTHDPTPAPELDEAKLATGPPEGWGSVIGGLDEEGKLITMCGWTLDGEFHQYVTTEHIAGAFIGYMQKVQKAQDILRDHQESRSQDV